MARGISYHFGLNQVDPNQYGGWDGKLNACINDAKSMEQICRSLGFQATPMFDSQCTAAAVTSVIGMAAKSCVAGDIVVISYSGHGGQVPDTNGDEADALDETWVLWDRQLIDDELYQLWSQFEAGVRIAVFSDSCHSGTVTRMMQYQGVSSKDGPLAGEYRTRDMNAQAPKFRAIPADIAANNFRANREMYSNFQWLSGNKKDAALKATVLLISGCQDNQLCSDGIQNGLFTEKLLNVWNNGSFNGSYKAFWSAIAAACPPTQSPNYSVIGAANPTFEAERPFTILAGTPVTTQPSGGRPSVQGPAAMSSSDAAPRFQISTGTNPYYVFEITNNPSLFDAANFSSRNNNNFYASWSDTPRMTDPTYTLSQAAWDRLRNSARLYYRIGTTSSPNGWDNYQVSTNDNEGATAPTIELNSGQPASPTPTSADTPRISGPSSIGASEAPPTFIVTLSGSNRFYAVEVFTDPSLADGQSNGSRRNQSNFYGSWSDSPMFTNNIYTLPQLAWSNLKNAQRLYYRMLTSSSQSSWENYQTTTTDSEMNPPFIEIAQDRAAFMPPPQKRSGAAQQYQAPRNY